MTTRTPISPLKYLKGKTMKSGLITAFFLAATAFGLLAPSATLSPALAGDLDPAVQEVGDSHFVRLGLNKSAVIRIPGNARDVINGNEDIVDAFVRSKNTVYLFARKVGQTNLFFFDAEGQQIMALDVEVAQDTTALKKLLQRTIPGSRITVDSANNNIILGGTARNALEAKTAVDLANQFATNSTIFGGQGSTVINTMKIAGEDQVMLKLKVVEIRRDVLKQFGINFSALLDMGKFAFNLASVNPFSQTLLSPNSFYKGAYADGSNKVEALVRAMEGDGLVRTLAEPNLTALTGQTANFQAGGEFPFRSCSSADNCVIEFKNYGVIVDFTPTVLTEGRINMKIRTEVSDISGVLDGIPSLDTRTATTVLEMPSGGTMMLAGLIRETSRQNLNGTPGLKQLPVLGSLFRSHEFTNNETELVIFATPYLVRPTAESNLASPDQAFNPPTDRQANFMGRLNKIYGSGSVPDGTYTGSVGFILE